MGTAGESNLVLMLHPVEGASGKILAKDCLTDTNKNYLPPYPTPPPHPRSSLRDPRLTYLFSSFHSTLPSASLALFILSYPFLHWISILIPKSNHSTLFGIILFIHVLMYVYHCFLCMHFQFTYDMVLQVPYCVFLLSLSLRLIKYIHVGMLQAHCS